MEKIANKGLVCGNWDVIHPGYLKLFNEVNNNCQQQFILLHEDPSVERPDKSKPVLSVQDRRDMLSNFFVDPVILSYNTEDELYFLIQSVDPDIRFMGEDYIGKSFTGDDLGINIHWISRAHGWSTTLYKNEIAKSVK
mgnify:FL=1